MSKAIIVGGTSGIGKALAKILLTNNYRVAITGLEVENLEDFKSAYQDNLIIEYFDCITEDTSKRLEDLVLRLEGLDLLVFSAGIGHLNKDLGYKAENYANRLNVLVFTEVADWSFRFFEKQGKGHFVGISSVAGLIGFRNAPAYTAAKAYQINYLEGLRQKARKSKESIFVTDIRPGFVDTAISKELKVFWLATPTKAASQIFGLIKKRRGVGYVTKRWRLVAIVLNILPSWIRSRI
jgi:short-subunit dehydrogenase